MEKQTYIAWRNKIQQAQAIFINNSAPGPDDETRLQNLYDNFADELRESIDFGGFFPSPDILEDVVGWAEAPVFLCGSPGQGMNELQNLLSRHSQLVTLPGESGYWEARKYWKGACIIDAAREWIGRFLSSPYFIPRCPNGADLLTYKDFLRYLHYFMHSSNQDAFVCGVLAYYAARANIFSDVKHWVEYSDINEQYVYSLTEQFQGAKIIQLTKDTIPSSAFLAQSNLEQLGSEKYLIVDSVQLSFGDKTALERLYQFLEITPSETRNNNSQL
jgi:hypothetical protein